MLGDKQYGSHCTQKKAEMVSVASRGPSRGLNAEGFQPGVKSVWSSMGWGAQATHRALSSPAGPPHWPHGGCCPSTASQPQTGTTGASLDPGVNISDLLLPLFLRQAQRRSLWPR